MRLNKQFRSNFGCQRLGREWIFPAVTLHLVEAVAWIFCLVVGFFTVFIQTAHQVTLILYPSRKRSFPRLSLAPWIQAPWTCSHYQQTLRNSQKVCKCIRIHNIEEKNTLLADEDCCGSSHAEEQSTAMSQDISVHQKFHWRSGTVFWKQILSINCWWEGEQTKTQAVPFISL